jgi:hypothetical protein
MGVESSSPGEVGWDVTTKVKPQFWHRIVMVTVLSACRLLTKNRGGESYGAVLPGTDEEPVLSHAGAADSKGRGGSGVAGGTT